MEGMQSITSDVDMQSTTSITLEKHDEAENLLTIRKRSSILARNYRAQTKTSQN